MVRGTQTVRRSSKTRGVKTVRQKNIPKIVSIGYKTFFGFLGFTAIAIEISVLVERGLFNPVNFFSDFIIIANVVAFTVLILSAIAVAYNKSRWLDSLRNASFVYILLAGIGFNLLQSGETSLALTTVLWAGVVLHFIMPSAVLLDYFIDRPKQKTMNQALVLLVLPLVYIVYILVRGMVTNWYPYDFLDPTTSGVFGLIFSLGSLLLVAIVLIWITTVLKRTTNRVSKNGFTIVELVVVIIVIAILATITVVGYGSWRNSVIENQIKSDLTNAASAMENAKNFQDTYPSNISSLTSFTPSEDITLTGGSSDSGVSYCIDGSSSKNTTIKFYIESSNSHSENEPEQGTCATRPVPPSTPTNFNAVADSGPTISLSWNAVQADGVTYKVQMSTNGSFSSPVETNRSINSFTTDELDINVTYYFRVKATNTYGESGWSATDSVYLNTSFGTIATATNLRETTIGPASTVFAWDAITCSLGSPQYNFTWVSPYTPVESWISTTSTTVSNDQGTEGTWKVQTRCTYHGVNSSVSTSSNKVYTSTVADPTGLFGTISWDGQFVFSASSNTFTCSSPAVEQYRIKLTKNNGVSGAWYGSWQPSSSITLTGVNQGSQVTTNMEVRCYYNSISSATSSSSSRADDVISIDAPGSVPGWSHTGNPKGERWSAVSCPTGTTASYWAYAVGDYSNPIWGAYESTGFYGYDRPSYTYGNTMVNSYLKARCISSYTSSPYGPQSYARY